MKKVIIKQVDNGGYVVEVETSSGAFAGPAHTSAFETLEGLRKFLEDHFNVKKTLTLPAKLPTT